MGALNKTRSNLSQASLQMWQRWPNLKRIRSKVRNTHHGTQATMCPIQSPKILSKVEHVNNQGIAHPFRRHF